MPRTYRLANVLRISRLSGQFTTLTPFRYRDPITRSWPPSTTPRTRAGRYFGSCEKSASIWQTTSTSIVTARDSASTYERPRPRLPVRCMTCTRPGISAARASATAPVPSGEASSTTRTENSGPRARTSRTRTGRLSRSLYVGVTTRTRGRSHARPSKRSAEICSETRPTRNTMTANISSSTEPLAMRPEKTTVHAP